MPSSPPVDAILLFSFGGPERAEDVMPFLRNVVKGRNVPEERLKVVAEQYHLFGGASPINDQNRDLLAALRKELDAHDIALPLYWGNRNWHPFVTDTVRQIAADGHRRVLAFATAAYSSYSSCRQYREDLGAACDMAGGTELRIEKLRQFFNHPGFIEPMVEHTRIALEELEPAVRKTARLVFTAHSIPLAMANDSRYESQLREAARLVATAVGDRPWDLAFQSRSGSPHSPWLEPDIVQYLDRLHTSGETAAVMVPIGFVSDHMEVLYDLDTVAASHARSLGMAIARAKTVGTSPRFVSMVRELIEEHLRDVNPLTLGEMGAVTCLGDQCCLSASEAPVPPSHRIAAPASTA